MGNRSTERFPRLSWGLLLLAISLAGSEPVWSESPKQFIALRPESRDLWPSMEDPTTLGNDFLGQVAAAIQSVPLPVRLGLVEHGWRVELVEYVTDAAPQLRGVRPRGWPEGMTWENTEAVHLPEERLLILAEKRRTRLGKVIVSPRIEGTLRHELGHAFDLMAGGLEHFHSSHGRFLATWQHEAAQVPQVDRERLAYYLQANSPGRQEVFAEMFALALGGGSDPPNRERLERAFPESLALVRQLLSRYEWPTSVASRTKP